MNNNNGFNRSSTCKIGTHCRNCTERYLGCHDHCEKYKGQVRERDERRDKIAKAKAVDRNYDSFKSERVNATKKVMNSKRSNRYI